MYIGQSPKEQTANPPCSPLGKRQVFKSSKQHGNYNSIPRPPKYDQNNDEKPGSYMIAVYLVKL